MSALRLEGKVAIVTGAGAAGDGIGNGRAAAILFAREGARVLLVDRDVALAEATQRMIAAEGGESAAFEANVVREDDCRAMVEAALKRWGKLDILQNNVGIGSSGRVPDIDEAAWERVLRVNVTSMMLSAKHAIPAMAAGGGGAIVNVSSIAAWRPRGLTPYATSKGAVEAMTRGLAADHAREGIRVNCIEPGLMYVSHAAALRLSVARGTSAYDSRFLAAAQALNQPLVTEDRRLRALAPELTCSLDDVLAR